MSPRARPVARALRNSVLIATTSARHVGEDPLLFVVQTARRLPAGAVARLARRLGSGSGSRATVRRAYGHWLAEHPERAADVLAAVAERPGSAGPRGRLRRRLAAELAVQVGRADLVDALVTDPAPLLRARARWAAGDLGGALAALPPGSALAARFTAELDALAGAGPTATAPPGGLVRTPAAAARVSAFHLLVNSVPHTASGYAFRSHALLRAAADAGVHVAAATRIGYPVSVGRLAAARRDVVDGVTYHRVLPPVMPRTLTDRMQRQVDLLLPVVRRAAPTVLHTTTHYPNALMTRALAERLEVPWVYEVRGLLEDSWVARQVTPAAREAALASERYRLWRAVETDMARAADHVVTLSGTLAEDLAARGVARERITVVPNGVDAALLEADLTPAQAREAVGLPAAGFWVGTVSSLVDYEGLGTVLEAVASLRREGLDARVCVVGDGVSRPGLRRRAAELGLGEHAVFPGRVPRDQVATYHQALDVFTVPRKDVRVCRMVTPLKPIEAMACGRPVVASDLPALSEIVLGPGAGALAPAEDAEAWAKTLGRLADAPEERASLGAAGRAFAAGRTWAAGGEAYRDLYLDLTEPR